MQHSIVGRIMNFIVSSYVYFVAFMLVIFMVATLVSNIFGIILNLVDVSSGVAGLVGSPDMQAMELRVIHAIAFTIVLIKAYKILIAYAETQHINIKFLVEIAIIGPTIELLFNSQRYDFYTNLLFAGFAFANLAIYLYFYSTLKRVSSDYMRENNIVCDDEYDEDDEYEEIDDEHGDEYEDADAPGDEEETKTRRTHKKARTRRTSTAKD